MNRLYILLTVMVAMLGAALFITVATDESQAQGITGCQNPQQVLAPVTLRGDDTTNSFTTTTSGFRLRYDGSSFDPAPNSIAEISIQGEAGFSETVDANADTSVFFNLPPGTYRVDVNLNPGPQVDPESFLYIVSVDQCRETTPTPTDQTARCQNPQQVLAPVTLRGDDTTNSFTTTTSGFRVNYDGSSFDPAPNSIAEISIQGEAGFSETVDANADTSVFFNLPPGTYRVDVNLNPGPQVDPESFLYIVSVDQCRETTPTPTDQTARCQNPQQVLAPVTLRGDDTTNSFTTTTSGFRVNYDGSSFDPAPNSIAEISIQGEAGFSETVDANADTSVFFNLPPGTYRVDVNLNPGPQVDPESFLYIVSVDQCRETTPTPTDQTARCQNPQQVLAPVTLRGDDTTNSFTTTTSGFRVNYDGSSFDPAPNSIAEISIQGEAGFSETVDANADTSVFFNLPPGTYRVDVNLNPGPQVDPESFLYIVSVDQCRETTPTPTDQTARCQNPQQVLAPVTLRGDDTTNSFTTTTSGFRVNYDGSSFDPAPNSIAEISIQGEAGFSETVDANADTSVFFNLPPGTYRVDVNLNPGPQVDPESFLYIVSVDQCRETTPTPTDQTARCQNPQQVLAPVTLRGDDTTNSFTTTTSGFRVNYDGSSFDPAPNSIAEISIQGEAGFSETVDANADTSVFFNLPPGTYRVDVNLNPGPQVDPESFLYIVSVDQCRETTPTPTDQTARCQNPQQVLAPVTLRGDDTTNSFTTTTSGFRVNYDGSSFDPAPNSIAEISIQGEAGFSETVDANADTSVFFNLPPGTYRVDVNLNPGPQVDPESFLYIVSVDQCRETTPTPTDQTARCQNPQQVLAPVTLRGDDTTNSFTTTTSGFRVNYDGSSFDPAPNSIAEISIQGEAGFSETVDANADTSVFFNLPPGTYRVDVNLNPGPQVDPESFLYIVSVDQCRETTPTPTDQSARCQNPQQVLAPVTLRGDDTTNSFTTTTSGFRVNYDGSSFDPAPNSIAEISIQGEAGFSETVDANADTSVFFNLPPGTYRVDVNLNPGPQVDPESFLYIVSVDQCRETTPTPTDQTARCQNPQQVLAPVTLRGDDTTNSFTTTTSGFRVN